MEIERVVQKHMEEISALKTEVIGLKEKTNELSAITKTLNKLETLMEYQIKGSEKKDAVMEKQSQALELLSQANIKTSDALDKLHSKIGSNEETIQSLSKKLEETAKKGQFDWFGFVKDKMLPTLVSGGAIYFILKLMGKA